MKHPVLALLMISALVLCLSRPATALAPNPGPVAGPAVLQQEAQNVEFVSQSGDTANHVAIRDGLACISAGKRLVVLDIADPAHPVVLGQTDLTAEGIEGLALAGDYVYASAGGAGLRVLDVSTPASPAEVGSFHAAGEEIYGDVFPVGSTAYVPDYNRYFGGGLGILDVADPAQPREISFFGTLYRNGVGVEVAGDYAYLISYPELHVLNISNPRNVVQVGLVNVGANSGAIALDVQGRYAYVAVRWAGLHVVDISDSSAPVPVALYDTPGRAMAVVVEGNYAYIADETGGLRVLDVCNPRAPVEVGFYDSPGSAGDVAVEGVTLRFSPSTTASIPTDGGTLESTLDGTTYTFPAGTFSAAVVVTHTTRCPMSAPSPGNRVGIGHVFELAAVYSDSGQPAQPVAGQTYAVSVHYTDAQRGPAREETLGLYAWDGQAWSAEGITGSVNGADNVVSAQVDRPGLFAVLGETWRAYLPPVLRSR